MLRRQTAAKRLREEKGKSMNNEKMEAKIEKCLKDTRAKAESIYRAGYKEGYNDKAIEVVEEEATSAAWYLEGLKDAYQCLKTQWLFAPTAPSELFAKSAEEFVESVTESDEEDEEEKYTNKLRVGDEVVDQNGLTAIVTNTDTHYHLYYPKSGKTWKASKDIRFTKTGRVIELLQTLAD